jgi:hypothetical protein
VFSWKPAWWNVFLQKRANLHLLPKTMHLANDPWFILTRKHAKKCIEFITYQPKLTITICEGGLANESLFAIILYSYRELGLYAGSTTTTHQNNPKLIEWQSDTIINKKTHATDWDRMTSITSPYLFKEANERDIAFIEKNLENLNENEMVMFVRKISPEFPDNVLYHYIYNHKEKDDLILGKNIDENVIKTIYINLLYGDLFNKIFFLYQIFFFGFVFKLDLVKIHDIGANIGYTPSHIFIEPNNHTWSSRQTSPINIHGWSR